MRSVPGSGNDRVSSLLDGSDAGETPSLPLPVLTSHPHLTLNFQECTAHWTFTELEGQKVVAWSLTAGLPVHINESFAGRDCPSAAQASNR